MTGAYGEFWHALKFCSASGCDHAPSVLEGGLLDVSFAVEGSMIYYAVQGTSHDGYISTLPLGHPSTGDGIVLARSENRPRAIAADAKYVFWTTADGELRRVVKP